MSMFKRIRDIFRKKERTQYVSDPDKELADAQELLDRRIQSLGYKNFKVGNPFQQPIRVREEKLKKETILSDIELDNFSCGLKELIKRNKALEEQSLDPKMKHLAYGTILNIMHSEVKKNPYLASIWINFLEGDDTNKSFGIKTFIDENENLKEVWEKDKDTAYVLAIEEIAKKIKEDPNCATRLVALFGWNLPSIHNSKQVVLGKKIKSVSSQED